jgi:hypothetical protein
VFSIAVPETIKIEIQGEVQLGTNPEALKFGLIVLKDEGLAVRVTRARLTEWHDYVTYNQPRTKEQYSEEALLMYEERARQRFAEQADNVVQWSRNLMQKEIPGGFISIRLATWWGDNLVPHSFTLFAAVSDYWIVIVSVEEEVPTKTGEIVKSFAWLPNAQMHPESNLARLQKSSPSELQADNWD